MHAVEEAARLLDADGAIVYLVDAEKRLRFAVDAGIKDPEAQQLIRDLALPVGVGLFGHSVAAGEVVVTGDYAKDERFSHSPIADRIVTITGIRTMAAAPLIADGEVLGALGAYNSRPDDFTEADVALLRSLAEHAAAAIANQRLIARLAESQAELARHVEAQKTLGEMATQLTSLRKPSAVLEHALAGGRSPARRGWRPDRDRRAGRAGSAALARWPLPGRTTAWFPSRRRTRRRSSMASRARAARGAPVVDHRLHPRHRLRPRRGLRPRRAGARASAP